jgi:multidrug resistance protein, MATE family
MLALHVISLALSFGLASAAGVRVGNAVGAGEPHEVARRGWIAVGIAAVSLLTAGLVYFLFADLLVRPFSDDAEVLRLAEAMVLVMGPFLLFDGVQVVMIFSLRAAGDQVAAGVIQAVSFFAVQGAVAWLLIERWDRGPVGLAEAVAVAILVGALLACARFAWITRRRRGSPGLQPSP